MEIQDVSGILINLVGWIPAVILPTATLSQLVKIIRSKSVEGVSLATWLLFGIANVGLYIFTEKYFALQSLLGLLGTAIMDFVIVTMVVFIRGDQEFLTEEIRPNEVVPSDPKSSDA